VKGQDSKWVSIKGAGEHNRRKNWGKNKRNAYTEINQIKRRQNIKSQTAV
jgi:hypothetical protein